MISARFAWRWRQCTSLAFNVFLGVVFSTTLWAEPKTIHPLAPTGQASDWSLLLKEGNAQSFILMLENLKSSCIKSGNKVTGHLSARISNEQQCPQRIKSVIGYRDEQGRSLLEVYLAHSQPDDINNPSSKTIVQEGRRIVDLLTLMGMPLADWENKKNSSDNVYFLAVKYKKFGLLDQLLHDLSKYDRSNYLQIDKLRSSNGKSLAVTLTEHYADHPSTLTIALNHELIKNSGQPTYIEGVGILVFKEPEGPLQLDHKEPAL